VKKKIVRGWWSIVHFIYGFITALLYFIVSPWFAMLNYVSFHVYEFIEYFIIKDKVYFDLREYYAGLAGGGLLWMALASTT